MLKYTQGVHTIILCICDVKRRPTYKYDNDAPSDGLQPTMITLEANAQTITLTELQRDLECYQSIHSACVVEDTQIIWTHG